MQLTEVSYEPAIDIEVSRLAIMNLCYSPRPKSGANLRVVFLNMRVSDNTNFLKPNSQSRNLNIYGTCIVFSPTPKVPPF